MRTVFPVPGRKLPKAAVAQDAHEFGCRYAGPGISFARKRQHRVWPRFNRTVDHPRKVHPEKGKARVGHGINEVLHQAIALGPHPVVFAAKGDDFAGRFEPRSPGDNVRVEPGAVDDHARPDCPPGRLHGRGRAFARDGKDFVPEQNFSPGACEVARIGAGDVLEVHDAGFGNMERLKAANVRFEFPCFIGSDQPQAL